MPTLRLFATILLMSCMLVFPAFSQDAGADRTQSGDERATVVIYRMPSLKSAVYKHGVYLDKRLVVKLSSGGFTRLSLAPGEYLLSTGTKRNPTMLSVTLRLAAGETQYVAYQVGRDLYTPDQLSSVSTEVGSAAIERGYRYQPPLADALPAPAP